MTNSPKFSCQSSEIKAVEQVIDLWQHIARQAIDQRGYFTVAVSGGKTPEEFYRQLALKVDPNIWEHTKLFTVDERCVPRSDSNSNQRMIRECLSQGTFSNQLQSYWVATTSDDPQRIAEDYEKILKKHFQQAWPVFDLVLLGIGEDGHTASLFPDDPALLETQRWVVPVMNKLGNNRITMTLPVLNRARNIVFLVLGPQKAQIMAKLWKSQKGDLPAEKVILFDGESYLFCDQAAGSLR